MSQQQPSGSGNAGPSGTGTGRAIASLAKKQSDVTRLGAQKLKFVPTLPPRRVKEETKKEEPTPSTSIDRGRGRGTDRGRGRGRGRGAGGEGRSAAPRPPQVEMTASGPFAMGPALSGSSSARRTAPRSNFVPTRIPGGAGAANLDGGLAQTTAPSLKTEKDREKKEAVDEELYSDADEGVEIIDMENVRQMDYMAPESLRKEREPGKTKKKKETGPKIKKEDAELEDIKGKGVAKSEDMDVDAPEEEVNMANAVDLSESEEEEELEDIIDDFAQTQEQEADSDIRQERLYFFQFPEPFPDFQSRCSPKKADPGVGAEPLKKVTFAEDTKPPAAGAPQAVPSEKETEQPKVDGVVGQLEIYESGAVKMRLPNGILMDVTAATQPSYLQHAVYVDSTNKRLSVLGEVNRRFVVTPDLDALLTAMEIADNPPAFDLIDGLLTMDGT